mgnify:CR=1 FL=1
MPQKMHPVRPAAASRRPTMGHSEHSDKFEIVALCDILEDRAKSVAEKFGIPAVYTDYKDVLKIEGLDAIDICTPNPCHYDTAKRVLGNVISLNTLIGILFAVVMLLLLLVDRIRPGLDLFLKEPVKCFVLVVCMTVIASSAVRLADQRRRLRRRLARKKK